MSEETEFILHSDGGLVPGERSAAACIVQDAQDKRKRIKLVALHKCRASHEAESLAIMLGLQVVHSLLRAKSKTTNYSDFPNEDAKPQNIEESAGGAANIRNSKCVVELGTDCQYVIYLLRHLHDLESSSSILREKTVSRSLQSLLKGIELRVKHTPAHSGHRENEACHKACAWVMKRGLFLLEKYGEGPVGLRSLHCPQESWILLDLRFCLAESSLDECDFSDRFRGADNFNEILRQRVDFFVGNLLGQSLALEPNT